MLHLTCFCDFFTINLLYLYAIKEVVYVVDLSRAAYFLVLASNYSVPKGLDLILRSILSN